MTIGIIINLQIYEETYNKIMKELDKNTLIYDLLQESFESNDGVHCNMEFRSFGKKCICPICGGTVSLT